MTHTHKYTNVEEMRSISSFSLSLALFRFIPIRTASQVIFPLPNSNNKQKLFSTALPTLTATAAAAEAAGKVQRKTSNLLKT